MSWVTVLWSMVASACLTLAVIYFLVWWRDRTAWAELLFSATAASMTGYALAELWVMRTQTPAEFQTALRFAQFGLFFLYVSLVWFVRVYLRAGRPWLAWTVTGMRTFYVLLALAGINVNYREVPSLRRIQFLGESVTTLGGVQSRWTVFGQLSVLLILVFVVDASVTAWRRGDHRKARTIGGAVVFFFLAGLATSSAVYWGQAQAPLVTSECYLGMVVVMGYELSRDLLRASQLVRELQVSEVGLRESEARMSLAVEAGDFGIWIWNIARNDIWASDSWRALFGLAPSGPLTPESVLQRVHPDDRDALSQTQALALAGSNEGRYETEYRVVLPDGAIRWIASRGRVDLDATGRPVLMSGASRDITARKKTEEEAVLLRQEIAHAGRVSMMGQLASGLAHEINQPLAAILRNAEAAELFLQHPSPDLDEIRAILADIRADDERAGDVIDRMRRMLKQQTLDTRPLDMWALVFDVAALVRVDTTKRQIVLNIEVPIDLPHVRGDRVQLQQVLLNLILNAMDAIGGLDREDRRIRVTVRLDGAQHVEIAVRDSGPGIPAATLARVFDPFFTTKTHGLGMGLAISSSIIAAHGGRIRAENQEGGGAAFHVTLPIADEVTAA